MALKKNDEIIDESNGARVFLRERDSISRSKAILILLSQLLYNIISDIFRLLFLIFLKISSQGKIILFASNTNHLQNIRKYNVSLANKSNIIKIKNSKALDSIPQTYFSINGLYNLIFNKDFFYKKYSRLDIDEASYIDTYKYIGIFMRLISCKLAILSREDSIPFIEVALAAQQNDLKLLVFEHGVLTRYFKSFLPSNKTAHVYSSDENYYKRTPLAKNIFKFHSPLYEIFESVQDKRKQNKITPEEILIADTYNIRHRLLDLAEHLEKKNLVKIRLHPGNEIDVGRFKSNVDKVEAMARAKLVVTGISGFSLESAFSNIPTIILFNNDDVWGNETLRVYEGLRHVKIVELDTFIKSSDEHIMTIKDGGSDLVKFQKRNGYYLNDRSMRDLRNFIRDEI